MDLVQLEWDSNHFGVRMGRLSVDSHDRVDAVAKALRDRRFDCVISRPDLEDLEAIHLLESLGFKLKDIRVDLRLDLGAFKSLPPRSGAAIRLMEDGDKKSVMGIARRSFWSDHFHRDARFDRERVDAMYSEWIMKCVREGYRIEVAELKSDLAGFIATISKGDGLYIELVAVQEAYRHRGIGQDLLMHSLSQPTALTRGALVAVQLSNSAAIGAYEKIGFRVTDSHATLHWWAGG